LFEGVRIENFRGIESLEVPLTPLTVLVGPNGVGKSSVLDAISLGGRDVGEVADALVKHRRQGLADPVTWLVRYGQTRSRVTLRRGGEPIVVSFDVRNLVLVLDRKGPDPWGAHLEARFGSDDSAHRRVGGFGPAPVAFVDSARPYDRKQMAVRFSEIKRSNLRPELEAALRSVDPRIRGIDLDAASDGEAQAAVDLEAAGTRPLALSGDGVRFLAQLVVGLMEARGGTALLEEPETHLHPTAVRALAEAIVERVKAGDQVVLSTHSLELVERLYGRFGGSGPSLEDMSVVRLFRDTRKIEGTETVQAVLQTRVLRGDQIRFVLDEMGEDLRWRAPSSFTSRASTTGTSWLD